MRRLHRSIYLVKPSYKNLKLTKELLNCEKTMSFNKRWGGVVDFSEDKWASFYDRFLGENSENVYFHIYNLDNVFVGEVSASYKEEFKAYGLNIKIKYDFRGNNHGSDALSEFLDYLFYEMKIDRIVDNVALDNFSAIKLLNSFGFREILETSEYTLLELKKPVV